jgi:hypothetical protein
MTPRRCEQSAVLTGTAWYGVGMLRTVLYYGTVLWEVCVDLVSGLKCQLTESRTHGVTVL